MRRAAPRPPPHRPPLPPAPPSALFAHPPSGRLVALRRSLEAFLKADPKARTHQSLVANLAALYQMTDGATASKQALERIVVEWAPDDFDVAALAPAV